MRRLLRRSLPAIMVSAFAGFEVTMAVRHHGADTFSAVFWPVMAAAFAWLVFAYGLLTDRMSGLTGSVIQTNIELVAQLETLTAVLEAQARSEASDG